MADLPTTLAGVLDASGKYLESRRVPEARRFADLLMSATLKIPILELRLRGQQVLTEAQLELLRQGVRRAAAGEPVQYVLGEWDFMGRTFKVDRRALIPRPETECLVELVLAAQDVWRPHAADEGQGPCILDLGTGSGCIAISIAKERPNARYLAVDVSEDALSLARENAALHDVQHCVTFTNQDLADILEPASVAAVVANLPYIPSRECERLPVMVRDFEPRLALDGGRDGLDIIRARVEESAILLRERGQIFLEIGAEQGEAVVSLLEENGFSEPHIRQDLTGRDRMVSAVLRCE